MLGDAMSSTTSHQVTSEEVSCGAIPLWLVLHMKRVQEPELAADNCDPRLLAMYRDAHEDVKSRGHFDARLGGCTASPAAVGEQLDRLEELVLVAAAQLEKKCKKGTDVYAP